VIARDEIGCISTIHVSFGQVLLTTFRTVIEATALVEKKITIGHIAFCQHYKKAVPILSYSTIHSLTQIITANMVAPTIATKDLTFAFPDGSSGLEHVSLDLPAGSRTLLIGGKEM
jgi:hypothetical protein